MYRILRPPPNSRADRRRPPHLTRRTVLGVLDIRPFPPRGGPPYNPGTDDAGWRQPMEASMRGLMQHEPLTVNRMLERSTTLFPRQQIVTKTADGLHRQTYEDLGDRAARMADALRALGVEPGDRVGSFAFNTWRHQELYFAVPCMGAVLHTLNIRLHLDQVAWIANHAEDRVVFVDAALVPVFATIAPQLTTTEHIVVMGQADRSALPGSLDHEDLVAGGSPSFDWPELDEDAAAAMCYTSGTTGDPKGVVYSHRSQYLHSMMINLASCLGLTERDAVLPVVPR